MINKKVFYVFMIPLVAFFLIELVLGQFQLSRILNLIENFLFSGILLLAISFLRNKKLQIISLKLAYILFCFCLLFETIYYFNFNSVFSTSTLFVILETHQGEAEEFIRSYFNIETLFALIVFMVLQLLGWRYLGKCIGRKKRNRLKPVQRVVIVVVILIFLKLTKLIVFNVPYLFLKNCHVYYKEMKLLTNYGSENKLGHFSNVKRTIEFNENEVYVVMVGESTSKAHFNLYKNYTRETTPKLNEIRDELVLCNNVISPHVYTIGSLTKALTLGNYENIEAKYRGSIFQLLNQAGFETYWISNQRPVGISDTQVTKIAQGAQYSKFLNLKHTSEKTPYDNVLVDALDSVLMEKGGKKIVFLHMIGAHVNYDMRYPERFNFFKDVPTTKFQEDENYQVINAYDNVMKYTDFLVREVIEKVRQVEGKSFVLYFSDHGHEVYDEINFFGQTVDQLVTKNMYEIPMFLWQSESYKKEKPLSNEISNKYMIDDMFHTLADLCFVKSNEVDSTRSIFNKGFLERKRIIKNNVDFDVYRDRLNEL